MIRSRCPLPGARSAATGGGGAQGRAESGRLDRPTPTISTRPRRRSRRGQTSLRFDTPRRAEIVKRRGAGAPASRVQAELDRRRAGDGADAGEASWSDPAYLASYCGAGAAGARALYRHALTAILEERDELAAMSDRLEVKMAAVQVERHRPLSRHRWRQDSRICRQEPHRAQWSRAMRFEIEPRCGTSRGKRYGAAGVD